MKSLNVLATLVPTSHTAMGIEIESSCSLQVGHHTTLMTSYVRCLSLWPRVKDGSVCVCVCVWREAIGVRMECERKIFAHSSNTNWPNKCWALFKILGEFNRGGDGSDLCPQELTLFKTSSREIHWELPFFLHSFLPSFFPSFLHSFTHLIKTLDSDCILP